MHILKKNYFEKWKIKAHLFVFWYFILKLREETNTTIEMPSEGSKSDMITITGRKENVDRACDMIMKIQNDQVVF